MDELKSLIGPNENVLYMGKPDKKCFIFESIFNPLLPFAILWAIVDFKIFGSSFLGTFDEITLVLIPFFILHMMPVWIYLSGVLFMIRRYNSTSYVITDMAIYISGGVFTRNINSKPFAELSHINLHRGIFDQMFNVGDIVATTSHVNGKGQHSSIVISSISDYVEVYNIVKKMQTDVYADMLYPNAKRPDDNLGYNTRYKGL